MRPRSRWFRVAQQHATRPEINTALLLRQLRRRLGLKTRAHTTSETRTVCVLLACAAMPSAFSAYVSERSN
jgi:hypothetical protein